MADDGPKHTSENATTAPQASGSSVSPLPVIYELSPLEQSMKRTYIKLILCFPLYIDHASTDANRLAPMLSSVTKGYLFALNRWPFLTGTICPHSDPELRALGMLQIDRTTVADPDQLIDAGPHVARPAGYRDISSVWIKGSAQPEDDPNTPRPSVTLRISSILGGDHGSRLLLGFEFHRAVFDATSINMFLRHLAKGCFKKAKVNSLGKCFDTH
ncbi:hypothetical protein DL546_000973 [Coniochaeta pulveracea]|uniref:Condensation domain-containing protein n=1 Tax=Coniochaeta pulveracea TaxID=177199 RepID=A0A420XYU7_9PEZI|nr:hypothetical protein DL546_000973 [Coniochaeta pulveracea]